MSIKYIPKNKNEIMLFKREKALKERQREEITDNTLISLRRVNLHQQKKNEDFRSKILSLNEYINKQNTKKLVEIINYFIADIN